MTDQTSAASTPEPSNSFMNGIGRAVFAAFVGPLAFWALLAVVLLPFGRLLPAPVMYSLSGLPAGVAMGIGASQWLWLIPMIRYERRRGRPEFAKGILTGGALIFILNAGCWGGIAYLTWH